MQYQFQVINGLDKTESNYERERIVGLVVLEY